MAINIQLFEDTGAITNGHGTTRTQVLEANLKDSDDPAQVYYLNPIVRPVAANGELVTFSYNRYLYWKISGSYNKIKNVKIITGGSEWPATWQIYWKLSNLYAPPINSYDGSLTLADSALTLYPNLSSVGPEQAHTRNVSMSGDCYTQYLVLQFRALPSTFDDVSNEGFHTLKLTLEEVE
jgi:hypothetical protein